MNSLKVKQYVAAAWLIIFFSFGTGIIAAESAFDQNPISIASEPGQGAGGNC